MGNRIRKTIRQVIMGMASVFVGKRNGKWVRLSLGCGHSVVRKARQIPSHTARCAECERVHKIAVFAKVLENEDA